MILLRNLEMIFLGPKTQLLHKPPTLGAQRRCFLGDKVEQNIKCMLMGLCVLRCLHLMLTQEWPPMVN